MAMNADNAHNVLLLIDIKMITFRELLLRTIMKTPSSSIPPLYAAIKRIMTWIYNRSITSESQLDASTYFPQADIFTSQWRQLQQEANTIACAQNPIPVINDVMSEQAILVTNDHRIWRVFILKAFGACHRQQAQRAPILHRLVRQYPHVVSASYSYMGGHTSTYPLTVGRFEALSVTHYA